MWIDSCEWERCVHQQTNVIEHSVKIFFSEKWKKPHYKGSFFFFSSADHIRVWSTMAEHWFVPVRETCVHQRSPSAREVPVATLVESSSAHIWRITTAHHGMSNAFSCSEAWFQQFCWGEGFAVSLALVSFSWKSLVLCLMVATGTSNTRECLRIVMLSVWVEGHLIAKQHSWSILDWNRSHHLSISVVEFHKYQRFRNLHRASCFVLKTHHAKFWAPVRVWRLGRNPNNRLDVLWQQSLSMACHAVRVLLNGWWFSV